MITLRNYPYPYRAILSICSDLDETPDEGTYFEICRYLNTSRNTKIGKGIGLEVGNTIYFKMPKGQFSYENSTEDARKKIIKLIRSGHIDCLHSFGDLVKTRDEALEYWEELKANGCNIKVWIDHARAPSNLDTEIMYGSGATIGSPIYHADIIFADGGIEYVWKGRVTSIIAQNVKRNFGGIFNPEHPLASARTIIKEWFKGIIGLLNSRKYHMHSLNKIMRKTNLKDGTSVYEFMRSNPSWAGISEFEKGRDIDKVLTSQMLNHLINRRGCCILYTHLGKIHSVNHPFNHKTKKAFEMLAEKYRSGEVLTLTTKRQLDYIKVHDSLKYTVDTLHGRTRIVINSEILQLSDLSGITWYADSPNDVDIYLNDNIIEDVVRTSKDDTGVACIMIPVHPLRFPEI
jgi:hypothetical protein